MLCPICQTANPQDARHCVACSAPLNDNADSADDVLPAGSTLQQGAYVINHVLGQGGFGITYLGSDTHLNRAVAIKEFCPAGCYRKASSIQPSGSIPRAEFHDAKQQFLEEARTLARFRHPGIVNVFAAFEENNTAYMVMEYLLGKTLGDAVQERGRPLDENEAIGYIRETGAALEVVHEAGMLHRDIKPDNLMLCHDGRVVLIDFGTARDFSISRTQGHTVVVTPGYAPLEQYARRAQHGAYSDVYGLAATLFFLLTAEAPAPATDRAAGVAFEAPHQLAPDISPHVSDAVRWAMELKVDQRPQSIREFMDALDKKHAPIGQSTGIVVREAPGGETGIIRSTIHTVYVQSDDNAGKPLALSWPQQCACCGVAPTNALPVVYVPHGDTKRGSQLWYVPYCSACVQHVEAARAPVTPFPSSMLWAIGLTCLITLAISTLSESFYPMILWLLGTIAVVTAAVRHARPQVVLKPTCCDKNPAVVCSNMWSGHGGSWVYTLEIKNPIYRQLFEKLNKAHKPST